MQLLRGKQNEQESKYGNKGERVSIIIQVLRIKSVSNASQPVQPVPAKRT